MNRSIISLLAKLDAIYFTPNINGRLRCLQSTTSVSRRQLHSHGCVFRRHLGLAQHKKDQLNGFVSPGLLHNELRQSCMVTRKTYSTDNGRNLSFEEFQALLNSQDIQVIDVREPEELETDGKIPNAINIPLGQLKKTLLMDDGLFMQKYRVVKPQPHDLNLVFVGLGPIKSNAAMAIARKIGFKHARHFGGGFNEWSSKMNPGS
ncbi:hypothetical protein SNE40_000329 [Patella caerulea]|uniref:Rhodanese domain-containing protein n=1 Tax=Patella caerulea TaxID=87958 RepID=A0AAN8KL08_PATCE